MVGDACSGVGRNEFCGVIAARGEDERSYNKWDIVMAPRQLGKLYT